MLRIIEGLPTDTLGISATGTVTPAEYLDVLIPAMRRLPTEARLLYIAGPSFKGFAAKESWDGVLAAVAKNHIARLALVTNQPWLRAGLSACSPLLSCDVAFFAPADLPSALQWLADGHGHKTHHHRSFIESEILSPSFADIGQIVDAEDRRHDNGVARRQRKLRRKLRKSALMLEKDLRPDGRRAT